MDGEKGDHMIRGATAEQFYPFIQAEDELVSPVTLKGSWEMRALLTTLLFWGILVSAPPVWKRTRLCQLYYQPLLRRKPGSRCDTTGTPWKKGAENTTFMKMQTKLSLAACTLHELVWYLMCSQSQMVLHRKRWCGFLCYNVRHKLVRQTVPLFVSCSGHS